MLPLPDLDDRRFAEMVEKAKKMMPRLLPEWTDDLQHDPGITFLEMFAWLVEMQQYYLNRVTTKNQLKFYKLLGERQRTAGQARTDVTFSGVKSAGILPRGTKLLALDQPFETEESLWLVPAKIEKLILHAGSDMHDLSAANGNVGASFHPFGTEALEGARLHIGFDHPLPKETEVSLTIRGWRDLLPGQDEPEVIPSANVSWQYYGCEERTAEQSAKWLPLSVKRDETLHLSRGGRIHFTVPGRMKPTVIHPADDRNRYWISCTLEEAGYEMIPRVEEIMLNTVSAIQQETLSQVSLFGGENRPGQQLRLQDCLSYYGELDVQVMEEDGEWRYWRQVDSLTSCGPLDPCYTISRERERKETVIRFGDGVTGRMAPAGNKNLRVISYDPAFVHRRMLGRSSGLPDQRFSLRGLEALIRESCLIQVGCQRPGGAGYTWQDWHWVDDLDNSRADDRHFVIDLDTAELRFGNNENGAIPDPAEWDNICIISCQLGGGAQGNVKPHLINRIVEWGEGDTTALTVTNYFYAAGGRDRETMDELAARIEHELHRPTRAVTAEDYEAIAKATPGLRVARVKALPLYTVGMRDYPQHVAPAQITVVVVPYSHNEKPMPSKGFLETVKQQLDHHRLITTEVHVVPPVYIKVAVHAVVVVHPHYQGGSDELIRALQRFLHPFDDEDGTAGWEFGRTVYMGDLYGVINQAAGVEFVQDLWVNAEGPGVVKERNGDIAIPPHGLVYSGAHHIKLVKLTDL
ncbi:putative baseplate assembly protein [Brevibacillus humidisoli]|uniref:putative baseplate assembly protein n=1 Tax=Brevibacillus humidisoli TaxID=2895522 RepID=UPI001E288DE5|nr:putative baseplate assembly protein [Brevibacillus humidisoli]UFJ38947.1 putative baseplate assembly protein [Brevibacillus humidisoli]